MMDDLLAWLQRLEGPQSYGILALASLLEYVFPPFPGDTVALAGVFLALRAGYDVVWVYLALNVGAVTGGMSAYGLGRLVAGRRLSRPPRFLRTQQVREALNLALDRFRRHGAWYLALNRFVPALRAVFFLAAGMARLPAWKVALWGLVSAAVWNALLLGAGWLLGDKYEQLASIVETYSTAAIGALAVAALVTVWRWRRANREPTDRDNPKKIDLD